MDGVTAALQDASPRGGPGTKGTLAFERVDDLVAVITDGKKTRAGQATRRAALARVGIVLPDHLGAAGGVAPDDVLDAAVAAWSAHRDATGASLHLDPTLFWPDRAPITIWF